MAQDERTRWEARYRSEGRLATEPEPFVLRAVGSLPGRPGRALDLAGGTGRNAVWLASQGWDVTLADISPAAMALAEEDAAASGVQLVTVEVDLDDEPPPAGPWDLVVVNHYLNRRLLARIADLLAPGGHLVFAQQTLRNLERHERPGPEHLLAEGEAAGLVPGLEIVSLVEEWTADGRHEAHLLARKTPSV